MKKAIIIIMAMMPALLFAQTAVWQVVGSSGGYYPGPQLKVTSTVGETVVNTLKSSTIILTQGFQQPDDGPMNIEDKESGLSINIYPNPAKEVVLLEVDNPSLMELSAQLFDFRGTIISQPLNKQKVEGSYTHEINLSALPAGSYFLLIQNTKGNLKETIKIIKID